MNFQDAIASLDENKGPCVVQKWLNTLDGDNCKQIVDALDSIPINRVYRACVAMGLKSANATFYKHFQGDCRCLK